MRRSRWRLRTSTEGERKTFHRRSLNWGKRYFQSSTPLNRERTGFGARIRLVCRWSVRLVGVMKWREWRSSPAPLNIDSDLHSASWLPRMARWPRCAPRLLTNFTALPAVFLSWWQLRRQICVPRRTFTSQSPNQSARVYSLSDNYH